MSKKYNIIIPAAGLGTRLRPLTDNIPKCLVKINGTSIIDHQLSVIPFNLINKIIVITGYKSEILKKHMKINYQNHDVILLDNKDYEASNCAKSLVLAINYLNNNFIFFNSDLLFNKVDLINMINRKNNVIGTIDISKSEKRYNKHQFITNNNRIIKCEVNMLEQFSGEIIGPWVIKGDYCKYFLSTLNKISREDLLKLNCLDFLNLNLNYIDIRPHNLINNNFAEIDTIDDYNLANS